MTRDLIRQGPSSEAHATAKAATGRKRDDGEARGIGFGRRRTERIGGAEIFGRPARAKTYQKAGRPNEFRWQANRVKGWTRKVGSSTCSRTVELKRCGNLGVGFVDARISGRLRASRNRRRCGNPGHKRQLGRDARRGEGATTARALRRGKRQTRRLKPKVGGIKSDRRDPKR